MKKALALLVILGIVGFVGWRLYERITAAPQGFSGQQRQTVIAVEVAPIRKTVIRDVGSFTGTLLPRSYVVVAPKVSGRLEKLLVNIGDHVTRGQLIAMLDDDEYTQQVEQARAELDVAKSSLGEHRSALELAQREFERVKALRQKKIASESELDTAEAQFHAQDAKYKVALAQVAQQEAALKAARVRSSYTKIHVTWENGSERRVVGERFVDEGTMLSANAPIVSILDISSLTGVIHIIERDYSRMRVGQEAVVTTDAFPGRTFRGKIVRIAPMLKETSRQARVEIEIPNPEEILKPGMFFRSQIEFTRHEDSTVVPMTALIRRDDHQGVFLVDTITMKALFVPVTVGILSDGLAEVVEPSISGLVVTLGQHLLEDGSEIVLPEMNKTGLSQLSPAPRASDRGHGPGARP